MGLPCFWNNLIEITPNMDYNIGIMKYIDVKEAADRWGISDRRIRLLCNEGRIDGAIKLGWSWTIPADTPKPRDGRVLRKFRTLDIRPGTVDVDALRGLMEKVHIDASLPENAGFRTVIRSSIETMLASDGIAVDDRDARSILSGRVVSHVPLETHLALINARSVLFSFCAGMEKWCEKDAREMHVRLMQGIDDLGSGSYRKGVAVYPARPGENAPVGVQMETMFLQYENSWRNYEGITSAVLLYAAVLRIQPYAEYSSLYSYMLLAGELMRNGILPPLFDKGSENEAKAAFSLAVKRGNYEDFTHFIERRIHDSYKVMLDV